MPKLLKPADSILIPRLVKLPYRFERLVFIHDCSLQQQAGDVVDPPAELCIRTYN